MYFLYRVLSLSFFLTLSVLIDNEKLIGQSKIPRAQSGRVIVINNLIKSDRQFVITNEEFASAALTYERKKSEI